MTNSWPQGGVYERLYAVNYGLVSEPLATIEK